MDNSISRNKFDIITTIRFDLILFSSEENIRVNLHVDSDYARNATRYYMLSYHQERMVASARAFGWDTSRIRGPRGYNRLVLLFRRHLQKKFGGKAFEGPLMV